MEPIDELGRADSATQQTGGRRFGLLGALITLALVGVVVASFAVIMLRPQRSAPTLARQAATPQATAVSAANWPIFHDQLNLFSIHVPPEWKAVEPSYPGGSYTYTTPQGSFSGQGEIITINDPTLGGASASLQISAEQIPDSDIAHGVYCSSRKQETATFNGYPANTTMMIAAILFESANAHFQIDQTIPGVIGPLETEPPVMTPAPTSTPLPAATVAADQALIAAMLASFQPTDAQPLVCS